MSGKSTAIPTDYADWLADIKTRVATARQRAALAGRRSAACALPKSRESA